MEFDLNLCDALFSNWCVVVLSRVQFVNMIETESIHQFLLSGTRSILPIRNFKNTSIVQLFITDKGASFRLYVEDHDKDDADSCEDVVERDAGGYATQKVWPRTLNAQQFDAQRIKTKHNDKRQKQQQR